MPGKRSEVRSFRIRKEVDQLFMAIHEAYQQEYSDRLEAAGIKVDRSWTFTDTFERLINDTFETQEKAPQSVD